MGEPCHKPKDQQTQVGQGEYTLPAGSGPTDDREKQPPLGDAVCVSSNRIKVLELAQRGAGARDFRVMVVSRARQWANGGKENRANRAATL